jgi:ubiquinone biosynthesis protein UbiJ
MVAEMEEAMSDLVERLRDRAEYNLATCMCDLCAEQCVRCKDAAVQTEAADALEALASRIAEFESWKAAEDAHHHMLLSRIAALEASGYTISQGWQDIAVSPMDGRGE